MALASGVEGEGFEDVHACIRMPSGEAYLPGSSLKGAIRTAFATGYAAEKGDAWLRPFVQGIAQQRVRREFAAQKIDQDVFGPKPNSDVLRALRPSDLYVRTEFDPSDTSSDDPHVELVETRVTKKNGDSTATIMVEAFKAGTIFDGTLTDDADPVAHLNREQREQWEGLAAADALGAMQFLSDHAKALIDREKRHHAGSPIAAEYVALERRLGALEANSALAWVGWGTGWTAKTYGDLLTREPAFATVAGQFRLGDPRTFPTTRRHAYANNRPVRPMGWVQVSITPRGER
jgi:CRISPR type III-A-associated RAMP protein Csm5